MEKSFLESYEGPETDVKSELKTGVYQKLI
jgi:hypothetical protein